MCNSIKSTRMKIVGLQRLHYEDHEITIARLLGGFGGMLPRENFLKWCNLVRFREYFAKILSKNNLKNSHFLYKSNR